ncbi:helix-turn-helix domain-containing protein [Archaeoglobus neptunius]|uniref:helix-turn-helix domain-containing protein n=1 Tax=Archaeoglobus neptunius TaxID=2798580 RepID=UPI001927020A|nr:helix-turn-helix domain-containing protein [Archaeoglobus neptunius]
MSMTCSPDLKCVLKCALDISCLDMDIYLLLLKNPGYDVETLAEELGKDESTVYKSLRNLMDKGLVKREYRILKGGGYKYLYFPTNFEEFKRIARRSVEEWLKSFEKMIDELEELEKDQIVSLALVH